MSVSNTSSIDAGGNAWQQRRAVHQQRRQDFQTMIDDVRQGDLGGAQQALASLQTAASGNTASDSSASNGGGQDFASLVNAMRTDGSVGDSGAASSQTSASDNLAVLFQQMLSQLQASSFGGSGDSSASDALSALTGAASASSPNSLFNTLGQDLSSGNLSQAQQDYQQLQQSLQTAAQSQPPHHRHHHHGGAQVQAALAAYQANNGDAGQAQASAG
ncbi:hypothetical protein HNO92_004157 [Chromobacterium alkanivorans]|uniref:hypothetical protein n=1 Tax=Chromobacterium alkanivorans TaxID=1071719 RepID=UPI0019673CE0|nr:hypothetical protein [Chromobacterium alkanivorans]MBN3005852.1 hypothetical protein [Chromobacterium alkanivorans]MCS3806419.1 hypothetical protein [Chromobacterium alkanivorans]MCS3820886.1 hypothetical protein [Chromobacterium alkanivorans]MCS3875808.1 hypothetical protein [Chromobacterium alkanivorans]